MAIGYVPLPAFRAPGPLDFSGLNEGLDTLGKTIERNRLLAEQKELAQSLGKPQTSTSSSSPQYAPTNRLLSGSTGGVSPYASAIAGIESGGEKDPYRAVGPATRTGDRAFGKYQVMGANVGPWTQEVLGRSMTPEEFLANTDAQEKVFAAKFGQYVQKTGNPQDAASMWFTGRPAAEGANRRASNPDGTPLGITGREYVAKFNAGLGGGQPQPMPVSQPQSASAPRSRLNYAEGIRAAAAQGNVDAMLKLQALEQDEAQTAQTNELNSLKIQGAREELETKAQTKLAAVAQRVAEMPPEQAAAVWPKVLAVNPRIATTLQQYGIDPRDYKAGTALIVAEARGLQTTKDELTPDIKEYTFSMQQRKQAGLPPITFEQWSKESKAAKGAEFGTSPQYWRDKDGKLRISQLSKSGGQTPVEFPDGAEPLPSLHFGDTGTELLGMNSRGGDVVSRTPKAVAQKEALEERGKLAGQAQAAMPAAETSVKFAKQKIAQLRAHPGLEQATGFSNVMDPRNYAPGTAGFDFIEMNKQAEAKTFMVAREALKGAGQVTDFEGKRGEQAISNLNEAQSKEQYLAALTELEQMMDASLADLRQKATVPGSAPQAAPPPAQTEQRRLRFNPETGELE